jgi:hypothetical protein
MEKRYTYPACSVIIAEATLELLLDMGLEHHRNFQKSRRIRQPNRYSMLGLSHVFSVAEGKDTTLHKTVQLSHWRCSASGAY